MSTIAFLGLGAMGSRMVPHLVSAGHRVRVWNRDTAKAEVLVNLGVEAAVSPAVAATGADIVISMVRDDDASRYVWLDAEVGALSAMKAGAIAVESSTLTPGWVENLAEACRGDGLAFADAPVAGSRPQAEAAKLIYFVGADESTFAAIGEVLSTMGAVVNHVGPVGAGAKVKLAVNALFGVQLAVLAELLGFIKVAGLDTAAVFEVIGNTPVCSPAAKLAGAAMVAGNYAPAFPIELVAKDLAYVEKSAASVNAQIPLSQRTRELFEQAIEAGFGEDNITGIAQLYLGGRI